MVAVSLRWPAVLLAAALLVGPGAMADPALPQPAGKAILVVSGKIANTNDGAVARFDREMLEALGTVEIRTRTPWYDGAVVFEGVLMRNLMSAVGAQGTEVIAKALNDYRSRIPLSDFERYDVVLAMKRDGAAMPIRENGPLFIVYPFDANPELQADRYYGRSVWQLSEVEVR